MINIKEGIIIFAEESLEEAFNIQGNRMKLYVRNKKQEGLRHHMTVKLKTPNMPNKFGIPIIFDKVSDGKDIDGKEIYHFEWDVDPDVYAVMSKKEINKYIGDRETDFIDKALDIAGDDIIEYWSLDDKKDHRRITELDKKYEGYRI